MGPIFPRADHTAGMRPWSLRSGQAEACAAEAPQTPRQTGHGGRKKKRRDFQPRLEEVQPGLVLSVSESFNAELQEALELYI